MKKRSFFEDGFKEGAVTFGLRRGKGRKTVAIRIDTPERVTVYAPRWLELESVRNIVRKKHRWILRHQRQMKERERMYPRKRFTDGEIYFFLGQPYRLRQVPGEEGAENRICIKNGAINIPAASPKENLLQWYFQKAAETLGERVRKYGSIMGLKPAGVIVKNQKSRWGSCAPSGVLRFNWKIIMAGLEVIDYVVVHELSHLKHPNHSNLFWARVAAVLPDFRVQRKWLRENEFLFRI